MRRPPSSPPSPASPAPSQVPRRAARRTSPESWQDKVGCDSGDFNRFVFLSHIENRSQSHLRTFERDGEGVYLVLVRTDVLAEDLGLEERRLRHLVPIGEQLRNLSIVPPPVTLSVCILFQLSSFS